MAKTPKNPSGAPSPGGGGAPPKGPDDWGDKLNRFIDDTMRRFDEVLGRVYRSMKGLLDRAGELGTTIDQKLNGAFQRFNNNSKATVTAADAIGEAAERGSKKMQKIGLAGEVVGGIFLGVVLSGFKKVAEYLSSTFAPSVEAVTGGLGKNTEAATRMENAHRRLALQIELGQQKALSPIKNTLAAIYERIHSINPELVRQTAAWGQYFSIALKGTAILAGLAVAIANVGPLIGLAAKGLGFFAGVVSGGLIKNTDSLTKSMSYLATAGVAAFKDGFTSIAAIVGRLIVGPAGVLTLFVALIAVAIARMVQWRTTNDQTTRSIREQLDVLRGGSRALRELADAYENLLDKMELAQKTAQAELAIDRALANGETARAARLREEIQLRERSLQRRIEEQNKRKELDQFVDQGLISEGERDRALNEFRQGQAMTDAREAAERLAAAERDRQGILQRTLTLLQREVELQRQRRDLVAETTAASLELIQREIELAQARGAGAGELADLQKKATEGLADQKVQRIEAGKAEQADLERQKKLRENALASTKASLAAQIEASEKVDELDKRHDALVRERDRLRALDAAGQLGDVGRQRMALIEEEKNKIGDESDALKKDKTLTQEQRTLLEDQAGAIKEIDTGLAAVDARLKREIADNRELVELEKQRLALVRDRTSLENKVADARMRLQDVKDPSGARDRREKEAKRLLAQFRGYGRFGPETMARGERLDEAEEQLNRLTQLGEGLGDEDILRKAGELGEKVAKKRLDANTKAQEGIRAQSDRINAAMQKVKDPVTEIITLTEKVNGNIKTWHGTIDQATERLKAYRLEYELVGRIVERAGPTIGNDGFPPITAGPGGLNIGPNVNVTPR